MNLFPMQPAATDTLSRTTIPTHSSTNAKVQEKWDFLHSIDARCQADDASIMQVKPILWRKFTERYPLHGIPTILFDTLKRCREPPRPLNFLDIRNLILSRVPVHVNRVDLLQSTRRRRAGSAGKGSPLKALWNSADHEFFLLSSRHAISPLHTWYLPRSPNSKTYEMLATFGSSTPETYPDGWVKVDIMPGDLLIMPPGCPHAVFTPEHALTFGGNFYTLPHLGTSFRLLALQAQFKFVFSNESLTEQDYLNFIDMLEVGKGDMDVLQMANIATSGIVWGITDRHQTQEDVCRISWDEQEFPDLQQRIRLLIWDMSGKATTQLESEP
ncbi:hypothetical protein BDV35DRAFT_386133 [Aspergillus flavus]|uniref:JmjC domain-containing protein n=1 Tax=Aspergillus flavus TaxID=5059 RepID=A0A5N6GCB0_ASPFL|nr:hypothetical protein BDV35DRAFT_386133 [Aspergillus flavus]